MWYANPFSFILGIFATFICTTVFGIGILFTFFLDVYLKLDKKASWWVIPSIILTRLEKDINGFDEWLKSRHKIVGPLLIILSLVCLKMFFDIIDKFRLVQG